MVGLRRAAIAYCIAGLAAVAVFGILSLLTGQSVPAAVAFTVAVATGGGSFIGTVIWQAITSWRVAHLRFVVRFSVVGPFHWILLAALAAVVIVIVVLMTGHGDAVWNDGGWFVFLGGWLVAVQVSALAALTGRVKVSRSRAWVGARRGRPDEP